MHCVNPIIHVSVLLLSTLYNLIVFRNIRIPPILDAYQSITQRTRDPHNVLGRASFVHLPYLTGRYIGR